MFSGRFHYGAPHARSAATRAVFGAVLAWTASPAFATSSGYTYRVLVKPGAQIGGHTMLGSLGAAINDAGQVAFRGWIACGQNQCPAVFETSASGPSAFLAGPGTVIAGNTLQSAGTGDRVEIDNNGIVYYYCVFGSGVVGICTQSSVVVKTGDRIGGVTVEGISQFEISKSGLLVFAGTFGSRSIGGGFNGTVYRQGLFTTTSLLAKSCEIQVTTTGCYPGGAPGDYAGGHEIQSVLYPTINNSGETAFDCAPARVCTPSSVVAQNGSTIQGITLTAALRAQINNSGGVAFFGNFNSPSGQAGGIFTPSAALAKAGDTIDGHAIAGVIGVANGTYLDLSDDGTVVFNALLPHNPGCFLGAPMAVLTQANVIAESCDTFDGVTVRYVTALEESINRSGDIVFDAEFMPQEEDAVVLARPVNTAPTVVSWSVRFGSRNYNVTGSPRTRLPWEITGIQVVFSKPIAAANAASLSGVSVTGFSGLGTNTLTWTITPVAVGNQTTLLAGSGANAIKDAAGQALGGGGGFSQNLKILWGDVNDDGIVNVQDGVAVNNARLGTYNIFDDLNGDGVVNLTDIEILRMRIGTSLP